MKLVGSSALTLKDFESIVFKNETIEIEATALENVNRSYEFLKKFANDKVIYGINTGFGPMAQYKIDDQDLQNLQYNLIRSHCSGSGDVLPHQFVRGILLARLNTLLLAKSGVHSSWVLLFQQLINEDVCPVIYQHGGVGASGDLVQLAHVALCLIGEGEVTFKGKMFPASEVFALLGLQPAQIYLREGLAVMNGTSAMSGIGLINIIRSYQLQEWMLVASCMINEVVESYEDHFSTTLNEAKLHKGQRHVASRMRAMLDDSQLIKKRADHLYQKTEIKVFKEKVQEYYSIRCVPQILGPIYDTIVYSEEVLINEINSVNDNPVIDIETEDVYHGGNFHGDYVALEMDKLRIAITKSTMLAERQINFLMNNKINEKLPPFINLGTLGLNFGLQGVQFTATSTTAECQTLATPMYIHSIPNNNDNQDVVSMGTNSALLTHKVIDNSFEVIAIEFWAIAQAVDYLEFAPLLSSTTKEFYQQIRAIAPKFKDDQIKYPTLKSLNIFLKNYIRN